MSRFEVLARYIYSLCVCLFWNSVETLCTKSYKGLDTLISFIMDQSLLNF